MEDYLRAGSLVLMSVSQSCFEIFQLTSEHKGILVARGEVVSAPLSTLHIDRVEPRERLLELDAAAVDRMVIYRCSEANPMDYELRAAVTDDGIEIVLVGHHGYRCFWWRADVTLVNDEVIIRGPALAPDSDS